MEEIKVNETMRKSFLDKEGYYGTDNEVLTWYMSKFENNSVNYDPRDTKKFQALLDKEENNIVGDAYKHLVIDTVARSKANHTLEQQKAICQFMIDKYTNREKNQNVDDITKIRFYADWLEEIVGKE